MPDNSPIRFDCYAMLCKWPSRNNERFTARKSYFLFEGTLDDCIREFMGKAAGTRHLYEIHTAPQPPAIADVLPADQIVELARFRSFL